MPTQRMPSREALRDEVAAYVREFRLAATVEELPGDAVVPAEWRELLRAQAETGAPRWPRAWDEFADELPAVQRYLRESLCGVAVLVEPGRPASLLYVATIDDGAAVNCYRGRPPVGQPRPGTRLAAVWPALPEKLRLFYARLHDGWTELASNAGGPAASADLGLLSDPDWDLDPATRAALPAPPDAVLTVFSNSAGDYLALDTAHPTANGRGQGIIWAHDDPARSRFGRDFWGVLDAWTGIFFEETDRVRA